MRIDPEIKINQGGLKRNYTQNQKISQISPSTLIVGIDVAKEKHMISRLRIWQEIDL